MDKRLAVLNHRWWEGKERGAAGIEQLDPSASGVLDGPFFEAADASDLGGRGDDEGRR